MNVEQILEIFHLWPIFELVAFFSEHTLVPLLIDLIHIYVIQKDQDPSLTFNVLHFNLK